LPTAKTAITIAFAFTVLNKWSAISLNLILKDQIDSAAKRKTRVNNNPYTWFYSTPFVLPVPSTLFVRRVAAKTESLFTLFKNTFTELEVNDRSSILLPVVVVFRAWPIVP
jgi:hypothetical protein